jgi:uncharacterized membrane protein YkvA (DUF1232 family)
MADIKAFADYHDFLEAEINSFRGAIKDYIYYLPALFKALCGALGRPELDAEDRRIILSALGYFIAPNDLIPESVYGPAGYIDDVFVCCRALDRLIGRYGVDFIEPYWEKDTDSVEEFLNQALEKTRKDLGGLADKVLAFTGMA